MSPFTVYTLLFYKSSGDSYHYQRKTKYIYVHFMKDPPVVRQGDDQHQNLAINPGPKFKNVLNTGA